MSIRETINTFNSLPDSHGIGGTLIHHLNIFQFPTGFSQEILKPNEEIIPNFQFPTGFSQVGDGDTRLRLPIFQFPTGFSQWSRRLAGATSDITFNSLTDSHMYGYIEH